MGRLRAFACIVGAVFVVASAWGIVSPNVAAQQAHTNVVGVVDFYAPSPLPTFACCSGLIPERFAADNLSDLLLHGGNERFTVVPRGAMQKAQREMHWQGADVLNFGRMLQLAQAVGADRLVVGWILLLDVVPEGGSATVEGGGPLYSDVRVVVQVFDGTLGRLVGEAHAEKLAVPTVNPTQGAELALHLALQDTVPVVLRVLQPQGL